MPVQSLAYVVVDATDLDAWRDFGCAILGLQEQDSGSADAIHFRIDDRPFRLRIQRAEVNRVAALGLEFRDRHAFAEGIRALETAGIPIEHAEEEQRAARHVRGLARCADPAGNRLELVWGNAVLGTPFVSPAGVSRFVTGEAGMGHAVLPTSCFEETCAFYKDLLGFGDSDEMCVRFPGGPPSGLGLLFMHAAGPRHHVIAVGEFPSPSGLIHAMLEVSTLDEVGLAFDRATAAGHHVSSTLGRHTNDRMVSFYLRTPGGFDIEYGYDGWQCDDWSTFTPTFTTKEDLWGHRWDFGAPPLPSPDA